jgi:ribulose-5-phosphate 4-epimerase/fuculose-1-phosphate aldolase
MSAATETVQSLTGRPEHIPANEWELRLKLAQCYRIFDQIGWSMLIYNHITARVPGPEHHFLINPFGLRYDEVCASNLVKIDIDGNPVGEQPYGVNPAGFIIHSAVHANVPDAQWIMHTHTREGIAVSCKSHGLSNTNFYSAMIWDHVAYHDFEGLTVRDDEQDRLVASMGNKPLVLLRNHGLLAHGRTAEECFQRLYILQQACETQVTTESMAGTDLLVTDTATANSTRDARMFGENAPDTVGKDAFAALVRVIDAKYPEYMT